MPVPPGGIRGPAFLDLWEELGAPANGRAYGMNDMVRGVSYFLFALAAAGPLTECVRAEETAPIDILEYAVRGNTVLPEIEVEKAVYPFLGPGRSREDIEKAGAALEAVYREKGYQTVQVMASPKVSGGIVTLQVLEARVDRLRVVGAQYYLPSEIKKDAPSLAEGTVPDFNQVQNDIVHLNQWPDRKVTPSLRAGSEPGTVDVDLQVEDHLPLHASAELNNQQSVGTPALRTVSTVSYDNLWQQGHSISATWQAAPQDLNSVSVYSGSYLWRFPDSAWSLMVDGLSSNSNVATVGGTDVVGKGDQVGLHGLLVLPGDEDFSSSLTLALYYKHYMDLTALGGQSSETPVTFFPLNVAYSATLREEDAVDDANIAVNFAFEPLGSKTARFDALRYNARGQDFYVKAGLGRVQQLPWGMEASAHVDGQIADQPLITNEEYSVGGFNSVRGYFEAEELGDDALHGIFELRSPSAARWVNGQTWSMFDDLRVGAFFDVARVWLIDSLPDQQQRFTMASTGAQVTMKMLGHFNGLVALATPLISASHTQAGSEKILFRVWAEY